MAKDSQIDPKEVRKQKSKGGTTIAQDSVNEGRNNKKQSITKNNFQDNK